MSKVQVVDQKGNKLEEMSLKKGLFERSYNLMAIAQYVRTVLLNQRQGTSSTKNRGEVSGSGAKPWRQKGLGRARVGSKRNPLWRHGGIVHGPRPKSWNLSNTTKSKNNALLMALSQKISADKLIVIDSLNYTEIKSKNIVQMLQDLGVKTKALIVTEKTNLPLISSANNVKDVKTTILDELSAYDVLRYPSLIITKQALADLEKKYDIKNK